MGLNRPSLPSSQADIHPAIREKTPKPPKKNKTPTVPLLQTPERLPTYIEPCTSKVNELPPKERTRAYSTSTKISNELENGLVRGRYLRMLAYKGRDHMGRRRKARRTASTPNPTGPGWEGWSSPESGSEEGDHNHLRPPERQIVSAPPHMQSTLDRPVLASPVGNAFSGEHYWAPQFEGVTNTRDPDDFLTPTQPQGVAAFHAVRESVQGLASEFAQEAERRGETLSRFECDELAARKVLDDKNAEFAQAGRLPSPSSIFDRLFKLSGEETRAITSFGIQTPEDLLDVNAWMRIDESTFQFSTILDSVKEALTMLKERRKSRDLELSVSAYSVVYALWTLYDAQRKLEESFLVDEESDEEFEYEEFLKSIKVIMEEEAKRKRGKEQGGGEGAGETKERRVAALGRAFDLDSRRLKGKAPSVFDLLNWAEELKNLKGNRKEVELDEEEIGRAITKDD
ncbi:hypothetical protein K458DRAFT_393159 [Lentithecium fluviatile CBS 122367]|uniref:Uncharacterized protein n=1 Tax=Lentithecium fluviatile CBS 122367 TaxID=1168545 RepID=A0A6G1IQ12_9PLEO|nr:hypothetical protein K458DRAFT_393159 [Lentithecium fluviatile CBS 122367]